VAVTEEEGESDGEDDVEEEEEEEEEEEGSEEVVEDDLEEEGEPNASTRTASFKSSCSKGSHVRRRVASRTISIETRSFFKVALRGVVEVS
jgi:hypothetical protein